MDKCTKKRGCPFGISYPKLSVWVLFFFVAWLPNISAQTTEKKLDLTVNNQPLKDVFQYIQKNSRFLVNYSPNDVDAGTRVSIRVYDATAHEVLHAALAGTGYVFTQNGNTFIITRKPEDILIRGRITDEKGEPLVGVNVRIKSGNIGTISGPEGNYFLKLPGNNPTIVFSFIGYVTRQIAVNATQKLDVSMAPDSRALNEFVVTTALGIKREEKGLGYATTVVKGDQLTNAMSNNWTDALSGKVAGLNLVRSNAGPTGSNKIILRGENNLTGDNEALIVVDGVVINNGSGRRTGIDGETPYGTGSDNMPADYGTGLNDLNPEDIESVTVLKGPGAAALYGQRGANGAVIITTKAGTPRKRGLGVTFNTNESLEQVNRWPELQYEYGQGLDGAAYYSYGNSADGASTSGTSSAYGPKFDGQLFFQYDPATQKVGTERTLWRPYTNQLQKFFQTGKTFTNSISLDGGTDKTTARFSFTNVNNDWIIPNTGYKRNSVAMSVNSKINDRLTIASKVNYTNKWSDNLPGSGYGNQSLMYWYIFWQPNANIDWLRDYWVKGQEGRAIKYPFSSYPENPFAVSNEFINKTNRNGITGNVQATYNITKELSLLVRTSIDFAYDQRQQERPYDAGAKLPKGSYRTQNIFSMEASSDFMLRYNKRINEDFEISATAGGSTLTNNYNKDETRADSLTFPGIFSFSNAAGPLVTLPYRTKYSINSFYGVLTGSFRDYLFLDLTGRKDWTSTLATPYRTTNSGFFYPAANLSFVASDVWHMPKMINFAKFRFSASSVGSGGTTAYLTSYNYSSAGSLYNGGLSAPDLLTNPNLKPLRTITYELGANVQFYNNRLGIDVAVYRGNTKDQHLKRIIDRASGFTQVLINAGEVRNEGIEIALNSTPVSVKNGFRWSSNVVFSANRNRIMALADSSVVLRTGPVGGGQIVAKVGGSMGDLYGRGYQRAPDGQILYDANTGVALLTEEVKYLGNILPKAKLGWTNDFYYKGFNLHLLFDAQYGGVAHSLTHYKMAEQGKLKETLPGRYNGIIGNGVIATTDGKYRKNDVIATDIDEYYRSHYGVDNAEGSVFRTDYIKFREARIDYTFSKGLIRRLGFQRATVGVYGRDLFIWSPWPMFDPEFGTLYGSDILQGFEIGQFPSTRTVGFNLVIGL